ncbi:MAG: RICIN domain-containing protein [Coprococcus sp.]
MDVDNGNAASGTNLKQWQKNGSSAQKFKFYDAGDGKIMIRSKLGTYIDVSGGNCYNGANVWLYQENGSNAQVWSLKKGIYKTNIRQYAWS